MTSNKEELVLAWAETTFGERVAHSEKERAFRVMEEALELGQTIDGVTREDAHQLVDYVFDKAPGDVNQEVGGAIVTLAAFCAVKGLSIEEEFLREYTRIIGKIDSIRAKQVGKRVKDHEAAHQ